MYLTIQSLNSRIFNTRLMWFMVYVGGPFVVDMSVFIVNK